MSGERGGLEDVVACATEICAIDGEHGRLVYRGYEIGDLVGRYGFEEVAHLLWTGELPRPHEVEALRAELVRASHLPPAIVELLRSLPRGTAMAGLRTAVSALGHFDPDDDDRRQEANLARAVQLTGQTSAIVALWWRGVHGLPPLPARPDLAHGANFLYMLTGQVPDALQAQAMDAALVLHADHELNASTFAARVTAATLAGMHAAVTSAVGTLEGPLHGGANEAVMRVVEEVGQPERARAWVRQELALGHKIPGFGHRVYRTVDPRAAALSALARRLGEAVGDTLPFRITQALEVAVHEERGLYPNVDLYSGDVYRALGIPRELFTPVFAVSRVAGWTAHIMEQYAHNRLIRPRAEYVGPVRQAPPRG